MENILVIRSKRHLWILFITNIFFIIEIAKILNNKIFLPEDILIIITLLILLLLSILHAIKPHTMTFNVTGKGTVDSRYLTLIFNKHIHHEDLKKVKAIIHQIDKKSETQWVKDILLFEDGFEMIIPDGDNYPEKIVQWFKKAYNVSLPIILEDFTDSCKLPPARHLRL
jgi:hypothetical protein